MKTALFVLAGVLLRDLWCWAAAKVFVWRRCRQTQREARENRELRQLAERYALTQGRITAVRQTVEAERIKQALNPQLLNGRRVIKCRDDKDFIRITEYLHMNFRQQGKVIFDANFEEN